MRFFMGGYIVYVCVFDTDLGDASEFGCTFLFYQDSKGFFYSSTLPALDIKQECIETLPKI